MITGKLNWRAGYFVNKWINWNEHVKFVIFINAHNMYCTQEYIFYERIKKIRLYDSMYDIYPDDFIVGLGGHFHERNLPGILRRYSYNCQWQKMYIIAFQKHLKLSREFSSNYLENVYQHAIRRVYQSFLTIFIFTNSCTLFIFFLHDMSIERLFCFIRFTPSTK